MKTTLKTLLIASVFILPINAYAEDGEGMKMDSKMMPQQCIKGDMQCPMANQMGDMQANMGKMMSNMQGMMEQTKDPTMKEKMQQMHEDMGGMMQHMQQMHEQMGNMQGMMGKQDMTGKKATGKSPAKDDNHDAHHPAQEE